MLILALRAENFMKFHELNVEGLPSDGLIGVEGKNEGGKSTLGELLQFALFAKSATSEQGSVLDLIHWDRDFCTVEVDFVVEGEGAFRIWREIDRYGTNYSRLMPITESGELTGPDLAAGTIQVQQALARLLRFSFDDFGKSFYLAEQDFPRSPEQMRQYLDRMVGADVLIEAATSVQHEIDEYEEEFGRLQASIRRNTQQIEKYLPNIARIPEVEATRDNHGRKLDELSAEEKPLVASETQAADRVKDRERLRERLKSVKKGRLPELQEALAKLEPAYTTPPDELGKDEQVQAIHKGLAEMQGLATAGDALFDEVDSTVSTLTDLLDGSGQGAFRQREAAHRDTIARAGRGRGLALFFAFLCFLLAVALGLFAADLHYGWTGQDWFELAADAERTRIVMIASAASGGVLVLLSLFLLVRASKHRRRSAAESDAIAAMAGERADVEAQRDMLAKIDRKQTRLDDVKQALEGSTISEIVDAANTFDESRQAVLGGTNSVTAYFGKLADRENRVIQKQRNALKECKKKVQQSQEAQKREQSKRDRADSEIHEYHKQAGKQQVLEEQNVELREQADTVRDEIETRRLVLQLYGESVDSIRHRTGPTLGRSMRRLLPHLTGGRYHDLKVTPQFQLQVFTSEKSDFLQPQELSGGTFEALSLGFRLAFAQAFIRAVVHAPQFVFLDEPFKAMDRERIHRTIAVLKQLSQELRQVFVVLPGIA
ncbi:MAG: AAA family ATPase, partial [Planctomycetota bacterium]